MAWSTPRTWVTGEIVTAALLNTHVRDNLNDLRANTLFARKAGNTSRSSTTTLTDDPELTISVVANTTYLVNIMLRYDGPQAGDFKFFLVEPAGATFTGLASGLHATASSTNDDRLESMATGGTSVIMGAFLFTGVHIHGNLAVGGTAGSFKLQWAQNTSDASATTLRSGSHMALQRVG